MSGRAGWKRRTRSGRSRSPRNWRLSDINSAEVKAQLSAHSDDAIAQGVFGVPTLLVDGKLFWGLDALPMLRDYLLGERWFAGADWDAASQLPAGIQRQK